MSDIPLPLAIEYTAQQIEHENYVIVLSYIHHILIFWKYQRHLKSNTVVTSLEEIKYMKYSYLKIYPICS